jgi:plasmid stabilization system protein ParE
VKVRELTAAITELDEALTYYGAIQPRLAAALLRDVQAAKRSIVRFPLAWKPLIGDVRSLALRRFPYAVIYQTGLDEILIVAYAHLRRRPGYWRDRCSGTH